MSSVFDLSPANLGAFEILRGRVVGLDVDGCIDVAIDDNADSIRCSALITNGSTPPTISIADDVLVWCDVARSTGIVIGRVAPHVSRSGGAAAQGPVEESEASTPDTLVLEAKNTLVLRVGDGSITIRADGKILIKGKDLVSHATNMNRVKGGAVAIN
jgi:hypothetical protein